MTTLSTSPAQVVPTGLRLTLPRVVRSELRKILTSRSTWWTSPPSCSAWRGSACSPRRRRRGHGSAASRRRWPASTFMVLVIAALGAVVGAREFGSAA